MLQTYTPGVCVLCRIPPPLLPWSCPPSRYRRALSPNLKPGRLTATFRPGFLSFTPVFRPDFSNSCTWARLWASRRCPCTAARCTGKPAPSAAWPGTLTAPGTAPSVPDTFPLPRGRRARSLAKYLPSISPQCLPSSSASCARRRGFCVNDVTRGCTWELSAHLQCAVAVGLIALCSRASGPAGCFL